MSNHGASSLARAGGRRRAGESRRSRRATVIPTQQLSGRHPERRSIPAQTGASNTLGRPLGTRRSRPLSLSPLMCVIAGRRPLLIMLSLPYRASAPVPAPPTRCSQSSGQSERALLIPRRVNSDLTRHQRTSTSAPPRHHIGIGTAWLFTL